MTVLPGMNGRLVVSGIAAARRVSKSHTPAALPIMGMSASSLPNPIPQVMRTHHRGLASRSTDHGNICNSSSSSSSKRTNSTAAATQPAKTIASSRCAGIPIKKTTYTFASSSFLLEQAALEAQAILPLVQPNENQRDSKGLLQLQQQPQDNLEFVMNAAESLLRSTQSTADLAEAIRNASIQKQPQIVALHRAFIAVSQLCVSVMTAKSAANQQLQTHLLEHPLLDCVLQLSLRTHQLGMGFHLPLYRAICQAIASQEKSIHSPSSWILKVGRWAQQELGHLPKDFFEESLLELTKRQQKNETISILQGMQELQQQSSSLDQKTTTEILLNLKGSIRSMYQKQKSTWTLEEEHCREIILLLESSIWKLVDEQQQSLIDRPSILQDAIEEILDNTEQDLSNESCGRKEDLEDFLLEATGFIDSMEEIESNLIFDAAEDNGGLEGMDVILDDPSLLYTRPMDCNDSIPDITSQLLNGSKARTVRYSSDMEQHIYFQFCPMDKEDHCDDMLH